MNDTTTRGRARRVGGIAAGFIALLAGVAVAYFLTANDFGGNSATGGTLTVTSSLDSDPLNYGGTGLYPTSETDPSNTKTDTFSITNNNPVQVTYQLTAACAEQAAGQAGRDAGATPCDPTEQAQYEDLYIEIRDVAGQDDLGPMDESEIEGQDEVCNPLESAADLCTDAPTPVVHYSGYLSELIDAGNIEIAAGQAKNLEAELWLVNDENAEQAQGVVTPFVITVSAKTPA